MNWKRVEKIFWHAALAAVLLAAFFVRYENVIVREFTFDEALYAWSAERITDDPTLLFSEEIAEYHPPLFPILLAIGRLLLGLPPSLIVYSLTVVGISLLGIGGIFVLGSRISSRFLGLWSAICLAFSAPFICCSVYLLNDIPFYVLSVFLLLALRNAQQNDHWKSDVGVSIIMSLMIGIKYSGLQMVPIVALFYLFLPKRGLKVKLCRLSRALSMVFLSVIALAICNYLNRGTLFPIITSFRQSGIGIDRIKLLVNYYIFRYTPGLVLWIFFFGCFQAFRQKDYFKRFLILYLGAGVLGLLTLNSHDFRYGLFIVPAISIISGLGVEGLLNSVLKRKKFLFIGQVGIIIIFGALYLDEIYLAKKVVRGRMDFVLNYSPAAAWVKEHATDQTIILSQEPRLMRYYTRINFKRFGGRIIPLPGNKEDIAKALKEMRGHVILDVNIARVDAERNFHSFDEAQQEEIFLKSYGYSLKKVVYQRQFCKQGSERCISGPVIKIFERR